MDGFTACLRAPLGRAVKSPHQLPAYGGKGLRGIVLPQMLPADNAPHAAHPDLVQPARVGQRKQHSRQLLWCWQSGEQRIGGGKQYKIRLLANREPVNRPATGSRPAADRRAIQAGGQIRLLVTGEHIAPLPVQTLAIFQKAELLPRADTDMAV